MMQTGQRIGTSIGVPIITAVPSTVLARADKAQAIAVGFGLIGLIILSALTVGVVDTDHRRKNSTGPA